MDAARAHKARSNRQARAGACLSTGSSRGSTRRAPSDWSKARCSLEGRSAKLSAEATRSIQMSTCRGRRPDRGKAGVHGARALHSAALVQNACASAL